LQSTIAYVTIEHVSHLYLLLKRSVSLSSAPSYNLLVKVTLVSVNRFLWKRGRWNTRQFSTKM